MLVGRAGLGMRPAEATAALLAACGGLNGATAAEVQAEASATLSQVSRPPAHPHS